MQQCCGACVAIFVVFHLLKINFKQWDALRSGSGRSAICRGLLARSEMRLLFLRQRWNQTHFIHSHYSLKTGGQFSIFDDFRWKAFKFPSFKKNACFATGGNIYVLSELGCRKYTPLKKDAIHKIVYYSTKRSTAHAMQKLCLLIG